MKVYVVSLGCVKNLVDSEMILGLLQKQGIEDVGNLEDADILLVNTCAFIESAKEEAINVIMDLVEAKSVNQFLVVCGCLAQRYQNELENLIPEIDLVIPIREYDNIYNHLNKLLDNKLNNCSTLSHLNRVHKTINSYRYVKISEGCFNHCSYCAIPLIRGNLKSRTILDIKKEVEQYVLDNIYEINLISQDTTNYGFDLENRSLLVDLLKELVTISGDFKIRLLYLYPSDISDELIDFIKNNDKVLPYFDIPIQHTEDHILKSMNRRYTKEMLIGLMNKIRNNIPNSIIRTTIIIGYPNETNEDVDNLIDFIEEYPFDRLGCFTYSKEEDTKSYDIYSDITKEEMNKRLTKVMDAQQEIAYKLNYDKIGKVFNCIIEGYDEEMYMYTARSYEYAPDDIDGCIYVASINEYTVGDRVNVVILDALFDSLIGEEVYDEEKE